VTPQLTITDPARQPAVPPADCGGPHRRLELLIVPRDLMSGIDQAALLAALGRTLTAPRTLQMTCGPCLIVVLIDAPPPATTLPTSLQRLDVIEGLWPEPLGLRLTWRVESDRYGVRPIFYGFDRFERPIVSTRPDVVAALIGGRLSTSSVAEHLLIGYNIDNHSPFADVFRLRPTEVLMFDDADGFRLEAAAFPAVPAADTHDRPPWFGALLPTIADALARGFALELTGGVDSRLILATALHAGIKPRLAFTLGESVDEDASIARALCEHYDIEHRTLPVIVDPSTIASSGYDFVMRSGFACNACSYGWLPDLFAALASMRDGQIGGCGGEFATAFRFGPLDALCAFETARRLWARLRLVNSSVPLADLFGPDRARTMLDEILDTLTDALRAPASNRRARTDGFYFNHYLTQRMPMASGAVLSASAAWYQPLQPFMHGPYIEWGRSLRSAACADRVVQMQLIHKLDPWLGDQPYSMNRRRARSTPAALAARYRTLRTAARKVRRRLRRQRTPPDQGAPAAAQALAQDDSVRRSLAALVDQADIHLRGEQLHRMLDAPSDFEHELGVLISAGWAGRTVEALACRLRPAAREERMRPAA
jgi:hypothetical protein